MTLNGVEPSKSSPILEPVAIIGMGCLFPQADGTRSFWANIIAGVDAITEVPASHWRAEDYFDADPATPDHTYARRGGFLSAVEFPPLEFGITPNSLEATDTTQLLALLVAKQALENAGYGAARDFDRERTSVILGVTGALPLVVSLGARLGHPSWRKALHNAGVEAAVAEQVIEEIAAAYVGWQEDSFPGLLGNVVAGRIANRLNLGGTNCVVDAACASSLSALHLSLLELSTGRCDMALSGGMDTFNDIFMYMCFSKTPALSPTGNARPFDAQGDGTILGEGLGCVLLKRLADARRDGDAIFAVIKGIGTSSDGKGQAIYAPSPAGQAKALRQAYQLAGITPDTIELLEAHGTGTRAGDAAEVSALKDVFGNRESGDSWCAIGSVKSQIGHTKAAAGIAGLIKAALALHHKVLPPTIKVDRPIEALAPGKSPFYVNREKRPWLPRQDGIPRRAGVSAFGFGGSNFHCVLEEHQSEKQAISWDGSVQIAAFSAQTADELRQKVDGWFAASSWEEKCRAAAESRTAFRSSDPQRLVFVAKKDQDSGRLQAQIQSQWPRCGASAAWALPDGVFYGSGAAPGKLGMLFPGQGSQYLNMLRDLACQFPALLQALAATNAEGPGTKLSDVIYPPSAFSEPERQKQEDALRGTNLAQPALGAVSLGLMRILRQFGLIPNAVAGHSFGELTALCAAGRLSEAELLEFAWVRGRLMAESSRNQGGMLAAQIAPAQAEEMLAREKLDLVLANRNAPAQTVLSGLTSEIDRAQKLFEKQNIRSRRLPVGAAFHSPQVARVSEPFLAALQKAAFPIGSIPVFANTTGELYPAAPDAARRLLARQLAEPVRFIDLVERMYAFGVRTFVEVGPENKLTGLVRSILEGKPAHVLAADASAGKQSGTVDLARLLSQLAALGHEVNLIPWEDGSADRRADKPSRKPGLTIALTGANYRSNRGEERGESGDRKKKQETREPVSATSRDERNHSSPSSLFPLSSPLLKQGAQTVRNSIQMTEESILALQKITEQTAQLHRQFLEGQDRALQVLQSILQQAPVSHSGNGVLPAAPAIPALPATPSKQQNRPAPRQAIAPQPSPPAIRQPIVSVPVPPPPAPDRSGERTKILLEVVAQKTGYPTEMLELDMQMDTDLGIDSIKRVEIFSALQDQLPDAPAVRSEHLGSLRTLRDVAGFLGENSVGTTLPTPALQTTAAPLLNGHAIPLAQTILLDVIAEKTGYPTEMLELHMEMDTDLGIDSIKRVEIFSALQERLPHLPPIKGEHLGTLRTLRHVLDFLTAGESAEANGNGTLPHKEKAGPRKEDLLPSLPTSTLQRLVMIREPLQGVPRKKRTLARGEILLVGEASELARAIGAKLTLRGYASRIVSAESVLAAPLPQSLAGVLLLGAATETTEEHLWQALQVLQKVGPALRQPADGTRVLLSISRLDGCFGLSNSTAALADPLSGGLAGLVKTAGREWPEVLCKALDFSPALKAKEAIEEAAQDVAAEFFLDGPAEVGITPDGPYALQLVEASPGPAAPIPLDRGDVVLVTGGARGVTAEAVLALASAAPTFILLGRTALPESELAWLADLEEESAVKKALVAHFPGSSPRALQDQYREMLAHREVRRNLLRLQNAGAAVHYRQIDVRDAEAVRALLAQVRSEFGPVRGLIHGAGVLADRKIEDKTEEQFRAVYRTKVTGLRILLSALQDDALKILALFSSSTARFGRSGQVDYAIANEAINKLAHNEARNRPNCRVVAFNWGPWDGGMVHPGLKKLFADEGVSVIPLQAGADFFVRELAQGGSAPVEVVVLGPGSAVKKAEPAIKDESPRKNGEHKTPTKGKHAALISAFSQFVSVETYPVLASHVMAGHAVVPVALVMEWLAHGAMHANPGLFLHGMDDLRIFRGIKLTDKIAYAIEVLTDKAFKKDGLYHVAVELRGGTDGERVLHAGATVVLAAQLPAAPAADSPPQVDPYDLPLAEVYRTALFHGPDLQGIEQIEGISDRGIVSRSQSAPAPTRWIEQPLRQNWLTDPLVIDGSFQMMVLWAHERQGMPSLPCAVRSYRQYRRAFPRGGVRIVASVTLLARQHASADIDYLDDSGAVIARITGYECVLDAALQERFRQNRLKPDVLSHT